MTTPIAITFDTNTYSTVAEPKISRLLEKWWPLDRDRLYSKRRRIACWYIHWCIRKGRIQAGIPGAALAAESLRNADRVDLLLSVGSTAPPPSVPATRKAIITAALLTGFRVMRTPRIGYGPVPVLSFADWATDARYSAAQRQGRMSAFIRHFGEYPFRALQDFGERLSSAHGLAATSQQLVQAAALKGVSLDRFLWREGIGAEAANPRIHASEANFLSTLRKLMADWADFDIAATHYAYGYDLLCTEDQGRLSSNSIFGPQHAADVQGLFDLRAITIIDLAALCWKRFRFPLRKW